MIIHSGKTQKFDFPITEMTNIYHLANNFFYTEIILIDILYYLYVININIQLLNKYIKHKT